MAAFEAFKITLQDHARAQHVLLQIQCIIAEGDSMNRSSPCQEVQYSIKKILSFFFSPFRANNT